MSWLLTRNPPLKTRFTFVDAVLTPTLSTPRDPIRARAEMCLLIVCAREKTAFCRREFTVICLEL